MAVTRISGFATGLDTDSIVKQLMNAESVKLNQLKQKQQKQTWLSETYRQWNSDFYAFRANTLFNMKLSSAFNSFDIASSQSNAVSATATGNAMTGTYSVSVKQLAETASFVGNNVVLDPTKKLNDQGTRSLSADTTVEIKVNNDSKNPAIVQTANIEIKTTETIGDVVAKINGAKDSSGKSLGLQAIYDPTLKQFIIRTKATGADVKIDLGSTSPEGQDFLNTTLGINTLQVNGKNASIVVNGTEVNDLATNNVTIMGVNFALKNTTYDTSGNLTTSSVTVSKSVDAQIKNIKDFVDKYNELLDKMNKAISEPIYKDYQPLLEDQKTEMAEKQIELWEQKSRSGLLRNDRIFAGLINKMRNAMGSAVNTGSDYNTLASIGISSKSYTDKGKLYLDEAKLREALENDSDGVQKLFTQTGVTNEGTNGLINRLYDDSQQGIKDLTNKAGSTGNAQNDQSVIGKLLSRLQTDISMQTERLARKEAQYYRQFTAMEKAVAQYNSQGSWLYQQMGQ